MMNGKDEVYQLEGHWKPGIAIIIYKDFHGGGHPQRVWGHPQRVWGHPQPPSARMGPPWGNSEGMGPRRACLACRRGTESAWAATNTLNTRFKPPCPRAKSCRAKSRRAKSWRAKSRRAKSRRAKSWRQQVPGRQPCRGGKLSSPPQHLLSSSCKRLHSRRPLYVGRP